MTRFYLTGHYSGAAAVEVKGVAKNPLAIIALFISFMYGSASLILGTSIDKIDRYTQYALVGFLIVFPIFIFLAFLYLVIYHHRKLYAPGDYRSDESFLASLETVSDQAKRIEQALPDDSLEQADPPPPTEQAGSGEEASSSSVTPSLPASDLVAQAELAESLVADLFQKRLGGVLKRNVRFSGYVWDFAIEVKGKIYLGEVKYTRSTAIKNSYHAALGRAIAFSGYPISEVDFIKIIAIIVEDRSEYISSAAHVDVQRRLREIKSNICSSDIIVEAMTMTQLVKAVSSGGGA
jgi:hypothetical protein